MCVLAVIYCSCGLFDDSSLPTNSYQDEFVSVTSELRVPEDPGNLFVNVDGADSIVVYYRHVNFCDFEFFRLEGMLYENGRWTKGNLIAGCDMLAPQVTIFPGKTLQVPIRAVLPFGRYKTIFGYAPWQGGIRGAYRDVEFWINFPVLPQ